MKVLYFAWLRQRIGVGEEHVDPPGDVNSPRALVDWLVAKGAGYEKAFEDISAIKVAVNQEFADYDATIGPGDEVAFFPPVTGG